MNKGYKRKIQGLLALCMLFFVVLALADIGVAQYSIGLYGGLYGGMYGSLYGMYGEFA